MHKLSLLKRSVHPAKIARGARYDDVVESTVTAAAVGHDVVELQPHALERGVLRIIGCAPTNSAGISGHN